VTQVKSGSKVSVTIHQVNADGAGPYTCDLIEAGNNGVITQNLTVLDNVPGVNGFSQARTQQFNITVVMPDAFNCVGSSAGNVCTVRCRNNAQAGPFGGCFPVQQTDNVASANIASKVTTNISAAAVSKQVADDQKDFKDAVAANVLAGSTEGLAAAKKVDEILNAKTSTLVSLAAPVQTISVQLGGNAATAVTTSAAAVATGNAGANNGNNNNNNAGKGRGQNNNQNNAQNGGRGGRGAAQRRRVSEAELRGAY